MLDSYRQNTSAQGCQAAPLLGTFVGRKANLVLTPLTSASHEGNVCSTYIWRGLLYSSSQVGLLSKGKSLETGSCTCSSCQQGEHSPTPREDPGSPWREKCWGGRGGLSGVHSCASTAPISSGFSSIRNNNYKDSPLPVFCFCFFF